MARRTLGELGEAARDAWITAALEVLAREGLDGVRVELLARKLNITKGSFYHHFANRDELQAAMLERWRRRLVVEVIAELERIPDPRARFHAMMRTPYAVAPADRDLEMAVALWARRDVRAAAALEDADRIRIDFIGRALAECGVPRDEAQPRAVLALTFLRAAPALDEAGFAACERLLLRA